MKRLLLISLLWASLTFTSLAQSNTMASPDTASYPYWIEMMTDPSQNFYTVQKAFNTYYANKDMTKVKGWKAYKRWEYRMLEGRIYPDGTRRPEDHVIKAYNNYLSSHPGARSLSGDWTNLGPFVLPDGKGYKGLGRLNALAFDPVNPQIVWVGSPSGGLWKTSNGGIDWTSSTQDLPSLGVSAILVDYTDPSVMYIGTGDRDAGDAAGLGVYRSTDGGESWEVWNTGMNNKIVGRLLMHPTNRYIIFAATNGGVYRTTNGGGNWSLVQAGDFKDVVFKPGSPDIVYAAGNGNFFRSVNGGLTFTQVGGGLPPSSRSAIAVTANKPAYVYVILTNGDSFKGLYRSTDSGQNFTQQSIAPNIMSWGCDGGDGGQAWYDLDIACDPADASIIFAGGVNCFKSTTAGTTWNICSHWWGDCSVPAVHADLHVLEFNPLNNRLYAGNDGGVYYSPDLGLSWIEITNGLPISQVYKIGQSATVRDKVGIGNQDNGSSVYMGDHWQFVLGGDGMECAVDPVDANYSYATLYYGTIVRYFQNTNNGTVAENGFNGITESGSWITPFLLDEKNPNIMFVGYKNVWRSPNIKSPSTGQIIWEKISDGLGGINDQDMRVLEQSPVNTDILFAARYDNKLFRTDNCKGASPTWFNLTSLLPESGGINDIECDPYNQDVVYISLNNKIYKSENLGQSWVNITGSLPDVAYTSIVAYKNSHNGLYVSSDIGVFYKDQFMDDWIMFSNNLPPDASITEIEIYYDGADPAGDIIRAGTYGRGLWESDVYHAAPTADFKADQTIIPIGCAIDFTDLSSGVPTSWTWEFEGANPSVSNERNPTGIMYESTGTYPVRLIVMNEAGSDTTVYTDYITVSDTLLPMADFNADHISICTNGIVRFTDVSQYCPNSWVWSFSPATVNYKEGTDKNSQNPVVEFRQTAMYTVTLTVTNNNGQDTVTKTNYIQSGGYNLPFEETFETGTLDERNWIVSNPDLGYTWTDYQIPETGNNVAKMKMYGYFKMGERDGLISPYLNFSQFGNVYLNFDHAYAQRANQKDSLIIYVSSGCEENWVRIWENGPDGNGVFETAPSTNYEFFPVTNEDWCSMGWGANCFTIDLSDWAGDDNVKIKFESYNNFGNNLYLDNITVTNTTGNADILPALGTFTVYPNPSHGIFTLNAAGISGNLELQVFNAQGQEVLKDNPGNPKDLYQQTIDLSGLPKGVYMIRLIGGDIVHLKKIILD